jgi:threonine/homoserine/homoserine lactone efflux protein
MGLWIIAGHALIEMCIIFFLLLGFSFVLAHVAVVRMIGVVGGLILLYFGFAIIRDVSRGRVKSDFLDMGTPLESVGRDPASGRGQITSITKPNALLPSDRRLMANPVLGGIVVSMSNPYWWVWWATIGFAFMIQFDVSFAKWPSLLAFFLGHEAGDLAWYLVVSSLSFFGIRHLSRKAYHTILLVCGIFMMLFGLYLGIIPFTQS